MWPKWLAQSFKRHGSGAHRGRPAQRQRPELEALEDRCVPASINVTTTANVVDSDADLSSLAALQANPGSDGQVSLREGILAANNDKTDASNTIVLQQGATYTFATADNYWYGPNALPAISSAIVIQGNGAT